MGCYLIVISLVLFSVNKIKYFCQTPTQRGTQPKRTWTNLNKSGSELTLFSHVTTRTRRRRTRTSPNFTLQEGSIGLYLREGERVGVRKVSGGCLVVVWWVSGGCLVGVWKVSGGCVEGVWKCLESVWKCKFFGTRIFRDPNYFGDKIFSRHNLFRTQISREPNFLGPNIFWDIKFFRTNTFLT